MFLRYALDKIEISIFVIFSCFIYETSFASEHFIIEKGSLPTDAKELYIDLMKRALTNTIYQDPQWNGDDYNLDQRLMGIDWPSVAHTMVGMERLNNICECLETIIQEDIPGDCIETGVWRGGSTILMRAILQAYGDTKRKVWVVDSFQGFPEPNETEYPIDRSWYDCTRIRTPLFDVSMEQVKQNFAKYGLLDQQVVFVKGFFAETLPEISLQSISLLRLDGDFYESTMEALNALYPKLSKGGFVIIDDWCLHTCREAVIDYRKQNNINESIIDIDGSGVYWRKS